VVILTIGLGMDIGILGKEDGMKVILGIMFGVIGIDVIKT
jgi:hypothetical protein